MSNETTFSRNVLFSRMIGLVSEADMQILEGKRVAIPGCGGTGYTYAECLARMGVGAISIADADTFGPENMNRQFGCSTHTIGRKKSEVLTERLLSINPAIQVNSVDFLSESNVDEYLDDVDLICDTLDFFVIEPRVLLYQEARRRNIPVVLCCPVAFGVTAHIFMPDGMTFEDYVGIDPQASEENNLRKFGASLAPSALHKRYIDSPQLDFSAKQVSSLSATCLMATSFGSMLALMLLLSMDFNLKPVPHSYEFDLRANAFNEVQRS